MAKFLNQKIQQERVKRGLSTYELANELNLSQGAISRYETGSRTPSLEIIEKIARYFHLTTIDFLSEEKPVSLSESYQLTLKQEVIKEYGNQVIYDLTVILTDRKILLDETSNPLVILFVELSRLVNEAILNCQSISEAEKIENYLQYTKEYLAKVAQELMEQVA